MLCNITQNWADTWGGVPCQVQPGEGGTLPGGYPAGGYPGGVPPSQVRMGGVPCRGGTQLGQQKEYSLHGGRYASCVHAGGLSCLTCGRKICSTGKTKNIFFLSSFLKDYRKTSRILKVVERSFSVNKKENKNIRESCLLKWSKCTSLESFM